MNTFGVSTRSDDKERKTYENNDKRANAWDVVDAGVVARDTAVDVAWGMSVVNKLFQSN